MCDWGNTVDLIVTIPAQLSHTGEARRAVKGIDACLAPLVRALNDVGLTTEASCCGHGKEHGMIMLADGRRLIIKGRNMTLTSTDRVDLQRTIAESDVAGCSLTDDDIDALIDLFEAWLERKEEQG